MTDNEAYQDLVAVAEAAKAEVRAQGYRSTDMARALEKAFGEFWYEIEVPTRVAARCLSTATTEMDDGPYAQRCGRPPHGPEVEHRYLTAWEERARGYVR